MTDETQIGGRRHRYVSHVLELTGIGKNGRPATNEVFSPGREWGELRAVPRMDPGCIDDLRRVGFDSGLLQAAYGLCAQVDPGEIALKMIEGIEPAEQAPGAGRHPWVENVEATLGLLDNQEMHRRTL